MRPSLSSIMIVLFWLCMMCSLVVQKIVPYRREVRATLIEPEILALQWSDITEWNLIRKGDRTVGASFLNIRQNGIPAEAELGTAGFRVFQSMDVTVPVFGFSQRARIRLAVNLTPGFNLDDFSARIEMFPLSFRVEGFVQDLRLYFRVASGGENVLYQVVPLKIAPNLLEAIQPMMARHTDLKVGESYAVDVVDPFGNVKEQRAVVKTVGREKIRIAEREAEVFRIDTTLGDVTKTRWVDDKGRTLRSELFNGLVSDIASRRDVLALYPRLNPDLEESLRVPALDRAEFVKKALDPSPESVQQSQAMAKLLGQAMRGE
jgi:hypothetical protein